MHHIIKLGYCATAKAARQKMRRHSELPCFEDPMYVFVTERLSNSRLPYPWAVDVWVGKDKFFLDGGRE